MCANIAACYSGVAFYANLNYENFKYCDIKNISKTLLHMQSLKQCESITLFFWHLFAWRNNKKITKILHQASQYPGWHSNQAPPGYKSEVLLLQPLLFNAELLWYLYRQCSRQMSERKLNPWSTLPARMTNVLDVPGNLTSPLYTVTTNKLRKHSMKKRLKSFSFKWWTSYTSFATVPRNCFLFLCILHIT